MALVETTFPVGYICVALFSLDKKWYRAKVMGVSQDQLCYDIFFVDHGDREWVGKVSVIIKLCYFIWPRAGSISCLDKLAGQHSLNYPPSFLFPFTLKDL